MAGPTYQDAMLVLQLAHLRATLGVSEASSWMWSDQFVTDYAQFLERYPSGSEGHGKAAKICGYFETLGVLYKHGLINEDLLFDWVAVVPAWDRIKSFPLGVRERSGNSQLYRNFEALAEAQRKWYDRREAP